MSDEGRPRSLSCERCGASVPPAGGRFAACPYCGQLYDLSDAGGPRRGGLLLGADFRDPELPGWRVYEKERLRIEDGRLPRLVGDFPKRVGTTWLLLNSHGSFDNVDAALTISFLAVADVTKHCRLGLQLRSTKEGLYCVDISPKGNYCVARYEKASEEWSILVRFASHPALRPGVGVANRLRVVACDDQLRVHVNDVLVSSVRDPRFTYGSVGVVLENPGTDATFAISDLELREAVEND